MMLILIAPSEAKQSGGTQEGSQLSFLANKPLEIAQTATPKDLKCTGARYEEGVMLNQKVEQGPYMAAIQRYSGVQFQALDYNSMTPAAQHRIDDHVYILSAMYGLIRPTDRIANYKLPISTQLKNYRKQTLTDYINTLAPTHIINALPGSYAAMIDRKQIHATVSVPPITDYLEPGTTMTSHATKKYRGLWLRDYAHSQTGD